MKRPQLEKIIEELHHEAYFWSRQCCGFDDEQAKDILQHVYLKILEGTAKFDEKSKVKTWLFSVVRFTASEWRKKENNHIRMEDGFDIPENAAPIIAESHEELIQMLPLRQKEVLLLVFYHGLTLEKAAEVMEIGIGSTRTHYDRGKTNLKNLILKKQAHENAR
ncbi:RNA polymerase sigma factor [Rhodonellum sp.]|uniref:RNA polymerase sigma factor n=1 Tax=Rhodonellum sp. TaxID=2231180 RepID=UPI002720A727|nr:sigma-70 family RNA polymerase sigma factor [Rhodonellum sp.]MDO9553754.1 sigma-70 family RNA polymerase sigma factor [Rhodonellum sp.]